MKKVAEIIYNMKNRKELEKSKNAFEPTPQNPRPLDMGISEQ